MKKIGIILALAMIVSAAFALWYANKLFQEQGIYPNIHVEGTDIGNMSREEAAKLLHEQHDMGEIRFSYQSRNWKYDLESLGYVYDIDKAVEEAYAIGRSENAFSNFVRILRLKSGQSEHLTLEKKENFQAFEPIFDEIKEQVDLKPVDAKLIVDSGVVVIDEKSGLTVDREELAEKVKTYMQEPTGESIELPVHEEEAKVKAAYLRQINGVIGEYRTTFNNSIPGRNHNIRLAASRIDHVLLHPGEQFSFNEKNGEISAASGYVHAPVIVKGELQEGMGGGVCQVSSTLYNTALLSDMQITERRNHSIPSGYVPMGRDATIFGNLIDLKFKNTKEYPVYIRSYVVGNQVSVIMYGDTNRQPKVGLTSTVSEVIPKTIEKIPDPNLPMGKEEIEKPGRDGYKSVTTKTVNGVAKVVSRDYYPPATEKVRVGTKPVEAEPVPGGLPGEQTIDPGLVPAPLIPAPVDIFGN